MNSSSAIENYLAKSDPILGNLIKRFGRCPNINANQGDPFDSLVGSVISQMLSSKASSIIKRRLELLVKRRPYEPKLLLELGHSKIRECGISNSKIKTILNLANEANLGKLDSQLFNEMQDDEVIKYLKSFWGILSEW